MCFREVRWVDRQSWCLDVLLEVSRPCHLHARPAVCSQPEAWNPDSYIASEWSACDAVLLASSLYGTHAYSNAYHRNCKSARAKVICEKWKRLRQKLSAHPDSWSVLILIEMETGAWRIDKQTTDSSIVLSEKRALERFPCLSRKNLAI